MLQTVLFIAGLIGFSLLMISAHSVKEAILFSLGVWAAIIGLGIYTGGTYSRTAGQPIDLAL